MTVARFIAICCAFFLLALACTGYWLARGYPANLEAAVQEALVPYGIDSVDLEALTLNTTTLQLEGMALTGTNAEQRYTITIQGLSVGYQWRNLLQKKLEYVEIQKISVVLSQSTTATTLATEAIDLNELLPLNILKTLPVGSLRVHQWAVSGTITAQGHAFYENDKVIAAAKTVQQGLLLDALLESDEQKPVSLSVNAMREGQQLVTLEAILIEQSDSRNHNPPQTGRWGWQISGQLDYASLLAWMKLPETQEQLSTLASVPDQLQAAGTSVIEATIAHPALWPVPSELNAPLGIAVTGQVNANHSLKSLAFDGLLATEAVTAKTALTLSETSLSVAVDPFDATVGLSTNALGLPPETRQWLSLKETSPLSLKLASKAVMRWAPGEANASVDVKNVNLNFGNSSSRLKVAVQSFDASANTNEPLTTDVKVIGTINTRAHRQAWPELNFQGTAAGPTARQVIALNLIDVAQSLAVALEGSLDLDSGNGAMNVDIDTPDLAYAVSSIAGPLKAYGLLEDTPAVASGRATSTSRVQFSNYARDEISQRTSASLSQVSGQLGEYAFENLALQFAWKGIEQWQSTQPATISLGALNVGFPVSNIDGVFSLPKATSPATPSIHIHSFSGTVFGGEVYLPDPADWRVGAATNQITVNASSWELRQLVALQQGQEIDARGLLEGQLPLIVEDGRIIIKEGFLRAIPPGGSIRYQAKESAAALADSNEQLGMALELLEDFRFKVLSTDVKLDKAGNLLLGLALSGSNPTQFDGRQVNFNINLDQNIDPLLQSLRLSDTLVEQIEKRIR